MTLDEQQLLQLKEQVATLQLQMLALTEVLISLKSIVSDLADEKTH